MTEAETVGSPLLSRRAKEAIKLALALVIAYACALALDWDSAKWAGFAVTMVSLATVGQSLNKAAFRVAGTVLAIVVALTLIALFPQDRWLFLGALSLWIAFCTYMMAGPRHQYAWHVAAFACTVICATAGPDPANAFDTAMLRGQQTALGVLVYSLVSLLIWPVTSRGNFESASRGLLTAAHRVYSLSVHRLEGADNTADLQAARGQLAAALMAYGPALEAAESDTRDIRDQRHRWRRVGARVKALTTTLDLWRGSFHELAHLDLRRAMPGLEPCLDELERRFSEIDDVLSAKVTGQASRDLRPSVDHDVVEGLEPVDRAAVLAAHDRVSRLAAISRDIHADLVAIVTGVEETPADETAKPMAPPWSIDLDRLAAALRAMVGMWLGFLAVIYVEGIPGGPGLLSFLCPFIMFLATMPQLPVTKLLVPSFGGIAIAAVCYLLVMPKLAGFLGLGLMIFVVVFGICYVFAGPKQMLGRVMGLAMFVAITAVDNQQTYSFMVVANTALMLALILLIIVVTSNVPFSTRPERALLRLTRRFLRSCAYLAARPGDEPGRQPKWLATVRRDFHLREMATIPAKLGGWARFASPAVLGQTTPAQVQGLIRDLNVLGDRARETLAIRPGLQEQVADPAFERLLAAWRHRVREALSGLSDNPLLASDEAYLAALRSGLEEEEHRTSSALARAAGDTSAEPSAYRLLGGYRSVSEALLGMVSRAGQIDWQRWREERLA